MPIIAEEPEPLPPAAAPVIEVKPAEAVVRVSGIDDDAQLTAVLRAVRASASKG